MSARWPVLASLLALSIAPDGFNTRDLAAKVRALTGQPHQDYTVRQASYDLRKLRGKRLAVKPGRTRRYRIPGTPPAPSPHYSPCETR